MADQIKNRWRNWSIALGVVVLSVVLVKLFYPGITFTEVEVNTPERQVDNAVLLVLAYPEAICRTTEAAYSNLLPLVGIGKKQLIRAGHACLVIAKEGCEELEYFDNGRYIAPEGFCRVRGKNTDPELKVDVKAQWEGKRLVNVEEILLWLHAHPEKTHGDGTLYAGVAEAANYESAKECVKMIQSQEIIEYGPFAKNATNCARFVTDVIYNGSLDPKLKRKIRQLYYFTPSGLSNISASNSYDYYYAVDEEGIRKEAKNLQLVQIDILFDGGKGYQDYSTSGTLCPPEGVEAEDGWQWLGGFGYGAWYEVEATDDPMLFQVSSYDAHAALKWSSLFRCPQSLQLQSDFKVVYPAHYSKVCIEQQGRTYELENQITFYPELSN